MQLGLLCAPGLEKLPLVKCLEAAIEYFKGVLNLHDRLLCNTGVIWGLLGEADQPPAIFRGEDRVGGQHEIALGLELRDCEHPPGAVGIANQEYRFPRTGWRRIPA